MATDDIYLKQAVAAWRDGVTAFTLLSAIDRTLAVGESVVGSMTQLVDARDHMAALVPPGSLVGLHQDIQNVLDQACDVVHARLRDESPATLKTAFADVAERMRIVGAQLGQHVGDRF
jgi:hypothetical protein